LLGYAEESRLEPGILSGDLARNDEFRAGSRDQDQAEFRYRDDRNVAVRGPDESPQREEFQGLGAEVGPLAVIEPGPPVPGPRADQGGVGPRPA
jgi:hypothetical protein